MSDSDLIRELQLIKLYRQNPVLAAKDLLGVDLAVPQRSILESMWFKNFILVTAGRGSGKCIVGNSLVFTANGLVEIKDLGSKFEILSPLETQVKSRDGLANTSKWYYDGFQKTYKITTRHGYTIEGTAAHRVLVAASGGKTEWKYLTDVSSNDYVVIDRNINLWPKDCQINEDIAHLLGLLTGDGCYRGNKYTLGFSNGDDRIRDFYSFLGKKIFGFEPRLDLQEGKCPNLIYSRKVIWEILETWGVQNNILSGSKEVPAAVLKGTKKVVAAFLRGLFEADGGSENKNKILSYCSKSHKLAKQVQMLLLNFGVISKLFRKKVKYKEEIKDYYVISVTSNSIDKYREQIGFISSRKEKELESISEGIKRNPNLDVVPGISNLCEKMWDKTRGVLPHQERERLKRYKYGYELPTYTSLRRELNRYPFNDEHKQILIEIIQKNYLYDSVVSVEEGFDEVYDLVVPKHHSFVANGFVNHNTFLNSVFACLWALLYPGQKVGLLAPSFRQAKTLFNEVKERWNNSPLLQEATTNKPIIASDRCYLTFRQSGYNRASVIEAVPLGDGNKIRGARFYAIVADEFAQIPESIFNTVILPMGATVADPMENVKRLSRQRELIGKGIATKDDFLETADNKVIMTSSAFYQFNHMYQTKLAYEEAIRQGDDKFAVHTLSFRDLPEGFLSEENIKNSQAKLSRLEFRMEYEAIWEADSSGVFKASLIEKCRRDSDHSVLSKGRSGSQYLLGVDPARASDAFALCLFEIGQPFKLVAAWEYYQNQFPKMAQTIMDVCNDFNVVAINMDAGAGGGGLAMKDLLEEEERWGAALRIIDADDEEKKDLTGRRILHMFKPSPKTNAEAVYSTLGLMEKGSLSLPVRPQPRGTSAADFKRLEEEEIIYETVENLLRQLKMIEVSETRSGVAHFDVPQGGGHASQKKDLYTAFVLAGRQAHEMSVSEEEGEILQIGIIEKRPEIMHLPKNAFTESMEVTQAPVNSWPFRKTFKPGK